MGGGTEAFPDLGSHCQHSDCHQLDFLPFTVFCLEHRSYKSHDCPKSDVGSRKVLVCEICSAAIETTGHDGGTRRKFWRCTKSQVTEVLTFSNTAACKTCRIKICLKHRFPADHACEQLRLSSTSGTATNKFLVALASRSGKDCGNKIAAPSPQPSVKAW
ncbi:hypothetical protein Pfo_030162 [Paulownia fortunei]|nr:hypothetical protein Pfo_030162 [Paulownia fortunei]